MTVIALLVGLVALVAAAVLWLAGGTDVLWMFAAPVGPSLVGAVGALLWRAPDVRERIGWTLASLSLMMLPVLLLGALFVVGTAIWGP